VFLQVGKGYGGPRAALALNSNFILGQLKQLGTGGGALADSSFAAALVEEVRSCSMPEAK
jgi:hypothetical protein